MRMERAGLKAILLFLFILPLSFSCKKIREEALYDEKDDDWGLVLARAAEKCKEEGDIWSELERRAVFSDYFTEIYYYYKLTIENPDGTEDIDYIRIDSADADSMSIRYHDSDNPSGSRLFTFQSTHQKSLIDAIANGVCDGREDYRFESSDVDSSSTLTFTDVRKDDNEDEYTKITDAFTAEAEYPLLFVAWNKTRTTIEKESGEDPKEASTQKWSIEPISEETCDENATCGNVVWTNITTAGSFAVDEGAYNSNAPSSEILKISF